MTVFCDRFVAPAAIINECRSKVPMSEHRRRCTTTNLKELSLFVQKKSYNFIINGLNSEILSTEEVTDWLEVDEQDGGIEILNDEQIILNIEEEVDDDRA